MLLKFLKVQIVLLMFLFSIIFYGCSEESLQPQEEHFEAEGMVFYESGIKIAEIFRGGTQDTFFVKNGQQTSGIEIKFYNSSKQEIAPPNPSVQPLAWEITDIAKTEVWQHPGEEGGYEFHLVGKSPGLTQIEFFVLHEGHPDFRSGKIYVSVVP